MLGNFDRLADIARHCAWPWGVNIESHSDMSDMVKLNSWGGIEKVSEDMPLSERHFKNLRFHFDSP